MESFNNTMKEMGIECRFVDPKKPEQFENAIDEKTRCIYGETLPNPNFKFFQLKKWENWKKTSRSSNS